MPTAAPVVSEPLTVTIPRCVELTSWSQSEIYRLLAAGKLRALKQGKKTLILWESVLSHTASLPIATYRTPRKAA